MPVLQDTRLSRTSYPQQQTPLTVSPSAITIVTQQTGGKNPTHTHISPTQHCSQKHHLKKKVTSARTHHCRDFLRNHSSFHTNFLVNSTLKFDHQPGTFKCARVRCRTCPFISNANKISGPKRLLSQDFFHKNNYNEDFISRNYYRDKGPNSTNTRPTTVTMATVPYFKGTSETIARILQPRGIDVAHKPMTTLRQLVNNVYANNYPHRTND